jgi:dethiobiotin synthetase
LNTLLITGTDFQVGKTTVLMALIAYWQKYRQKYCNPKNHPASGQLGIMKPIDCFTSPAQRDCDRLLRLFQLDQTPAEMTPVAIESAAGLPMAADQAGVKIDLEILWQQLQQLQQQRDFVLLEAWGGLGSALNAQTTVADLAWDWRIPTLLVVPVQPGTVAQAVSNVALARQAKVHLKGIVLNAVSPCSTQDWDNWAPIELIQSLTHQPVLGCIPYLDHLQAMEADPPLDQRVDQLMDRLVNVVSDWDLERLLPVVMDWVA